MSELPCVSALTVENVQTVDAANGLLLIGEVGRHLPIPVQRFFVITGVPAGERRGHHAHRALTQILVLLKGEVQVMCDDGTARTHFALNRPGQKLHIPPGIWSEQVYGDPDATLLVLCDAPYDESDYLRDYDGFLSWRGAEGAA